MPKILDDAVSQERDGSWTFQCPGLLGDSCGTPGDRPFFSAGWPTKKAASARGEQHFAAHKGEDMPSLEDFRAEHGLVQHKDGIRAVSLEDI